jgi:hypothetical protein
VGRGSGSGGLGLGAPRTVWVLRVAGIFLIEEGIAGGGE